MIAKFPGKCQTCHQRFPAGAEVKWDRATKSVVGCPACNQGALAPSPGAENEAPPAASAAIPQIEPSAARAAAERLFEGCDPHQKVIAGRDPKDGNLRVVAAAGSGKTRTVVAMVARLLWEGALKPGQIITTTFTSKAAAELRERFSKVCDPAWMDEDAGLRVGTFHGIALRALRRTEAGRVRWDMKKNMDGSGKGRAPEIVGSSLLWSKIVGWAGPEGLPGTGAAGLELDEDAEPKTYAGAVDVARSHGGTHEEIRERLALSDLPYVAEAYDLFLGVKQALGAWDFADVLAAFEEGLRAGTLRDSASLVVVDEAQDNSEIQIQIARHLARRGSLYLVGDGRQSIYGWRGAFPHFFQNADKIIGAATLEIPTNYRSARKIVTVGNNVAQGKTWAIGEPALAARPDEGVVTISGYGDPGEEAAAVASEISDAILTGQPLGDFAVLTRTNAAAGIYEAALVAAKIPCVVVGGTPFFKRREVADVLAYVALASGQNDAEAVARVINRPKRMLGKVVAQKIADRMKAGSNVLDAIDATTASVHARQKGAMREFRALLGKLRSLPWEEVPAQIANLLAPARAEEEETAAEDEDRTGIPHAVAAVAKGFDSPEAFLAFAAACAGSVAQVGEQATQAEVATRVTISTMHKAKGLEWPVVFLSATHGVFPHRRASDVDEEERLFYVGVTRARDALHLTYASVNAQGKSAGPSRFLDYARAEVTQPAPAPAPAEAPAAPTLALKQKWVGESDEHYCPLCDAVIALKTCPHGYGPG